jgi:hypothetical protein
MNGLHADRPDAFVIPSGHDFKVHPPVAIVRHDQGFHPQNLSGWPASFEFVDDITEPDPEFQNRVSTLETIYGKDIAKVLAKRQWAGPGGQVDFRFKTGVKGVFDYIVTVSTDHGDVNATGCSAPKIIVEP